MPEETFPLKEPLIRDLAGLAIPLSAQSMTIYKHWVVFVVDLSSPEALVDSDMELLRVDRDHRSVVVGAGPFWIRGDVHLPKGGEVQSFSIRRDRFIPMTGATLVDHPEHQPQTFLVNRDQINSFIA
jgi:hypothetical protein